MYVLYSQASHTGTRILTKGSLAKNKNKNKQTNKQTCKQTNKQKQLLKTMKILICSVCVWGGA